MTGNGPAKIYYRLTDRLPNTAGMAKIGRKALDIGQTVHLATQGFEADVTMSRFNRIAGRQGLGVPGFVLLEGPARAVEVLSRKLPIEPTTADEYAQAVGASNVSTCMPWEEDLPAELQGISPESIGVGRSHIFRFLSEADSGLELTAARARDRLTEADTARATVLFVKADSKAFYRYHGILTKLWDDLVGAATKRLESEKTAPEPVVEALSPVRVNADGNRWLDPLPPEFEDVNLSDVISEVYVLSNISNLSLEGPAGYNAAQAFNDPQNALTAVVRIDRNQVRFRKYADTIRPRWNAWLNTARRALPDAAGQPDSADVVEDARWLDPLPPEFEGVDAHDLSSEFTVRVDLADLTAGGAYSALRASSSWRSAECVICSCPYWPQSSVFWKI